MHVENYSIDESFCDLNGYSKNYDLAELMKSIDYLNHKYGTKTIKLCSEGGDKQPWMVKNKNRTPNYLTDINNILAINI